MARIEPTTKPNPESEAMLAGVEKVLGTRPNMFKTLAHSPAALGMYLNAGTALGKSSLSGALREQIALTVAGANGCDYCASAHTALGAMHKVPGEELTLNLSGGSADDRTRAALTFARQIVDQRGHVTDADVHAVRDAGYDDAQIVDIVAVVAHNIFTNYFNHIAETEIDFPVVAIRTAASVPG